MKPIELAIATPTFGESRFLAIYLESIHAQTCEVLCCVCDGGSEFDLGDSQWSFVRRHSILPDPGMVACWSAAADMSDTPYLAFLADDNALHPEFACKMLDFLHDNPDCDAVFCNQLVMNDKGEIDEDESEKINADYGRDQLMAGSLPNHLVHQLFLNSSIPLEGCVMKRELWNKYRFRPEAKGALDLDLFTRMLADEVKFGFVPEALVNFRIHEQAYTARNTNSEHLRGMVWSMGDLASRPSILQNAIRKKETVLNGHLLRKTSWKESMQVAARLIDSPFGIFTLMKSLVAKAIRR
jgi:glycosyltransferase involved in cell wall biosynthesis